MAAALAQPWSPADRDRRAPLRDQRQLTALAFTLLGDGLRDVLDPRRVFVR
jgi:hypothetical protein